MPELPEVETIRRQLRETAIGKKIKKTEIKMPKLVYFDGKKGDAKKFKKYTEGAVIKEINRAAKILIITLSNGYTLLVHLKMTGQLIYRAPSGEIKRGGNPRTKRAEQSSYDEHPWPPDGVPVPNKWTHIIFYFTDGSKIYFNDLRQFGYMKLVWTDKLKEQKEIRTLGPEPLDKNFSLKLFSEMLKKRAKAKIKPLLMDQGFISGIGNIYADESLYYAGVQPTRPAGKLKPAEVQKLYQGIKTILKKSIVKGGTSVDTYVNLSGKKGGYEKYLKVYGREGEKCNTRARRGEQSSYDGERCGGIIKRIKLGSRSAHYCPKCQK